MGWAKVSVIFAQTHLVTLIPSYIHTSKSFKFEARGELCPLGVRLASM
jgi:hypothetical protein